MIHCSHQAPLFTLSLTQWNIAGPHESKTIYTARKGSCGKVTFLHLSVSHSVHRGGLASQHALERGVCIQGGGVCIWGNCIQGVGGLHPGGRGSASREGVCIQGRGVCIQGEEVCIQMEGVCIQGEGSASRGGVCIQGEGICIQWEGSASRSRGSASRGRGSASRG